MDNQEQNVIGKINVVPDDVTFEKYTIIDRRDFADYLLNYIEKKIEDSSDGFVININSEWGAGKTTFIQCWYNQLKAEHPVVYFDAWKSDFTNDAMLALMEAFHSQLMNPSTENKEIVLRFYKTGCAFVKSVFPKVVSNVIKHKLGSVGENDYLGEALKELDLKNCISVSDVTDSLRDTILSVSEQKNKIDSITEFKRAIWQVANDCIKTNKDLSLPVYVFIDELDRCRPTYAIEVIEHVKHFFDIKDFVFVLATETEQLQYSIKAVYGNGFNSDLYLSKFFNKTLKLPTSRVNIFIQMQILLFIGIDLDIKVCDFIYSIFKFYNIDSLREIIKILDILDGVRGYPAIIYIVPLIIVYILFRYYPDDYSNYLNNSTIPLLENLNVNFEVESQKYVIIEVCIKKILDALSNKKEKDLLKKVSDNKTVHDILLLSEYAVGNTNQCGIYGELSDYIKIIEYAGFN